MSLKQHPFPPARMPRAMGVGDKRQATEDSLLSEVPTSEPMYRLLSRSACPSVCHAEIVAKYRPVHDPAQCPLWLEIRAQAEQIAQAEQCLGSFMFRTVLNHDSIVEALSYHLAEQLGDGSMPNMQWNKLFMSVLQTCDDDMHLRMAIREDLLAIRTRDAACQNLCDAFLYYKGFLGLQAHRVAHSLWTRGRHSLARLLQARISNVFAMDIHPAATIGRGVMFDHASGVVIGETAVIGDNCSFLHNVTLGGNGKEPGDRHPKLGRDVSVGAGVSILGNIRVGDGAKIGAGSVVLREVPPGATMVGIPARQVVPKVASTSSDISGSATTMDTGDLADGTGGVVSREISAATLNLGTLPLPLLGATTVDTGDLADGTGGVVSREISAATLDLGTLPLPLLVTP
ncbi:hypothetical protein FOA52_014978 [Chlamydomonas sp. UWO 241]|nr:hypothetical protein FOA52_014978 [Chlamydomonas sp. UWO 241]